MVLHYKSVQNGSSFIHLDQNEQLEKFRYQMQ